MRDIKLDKIDLGIIVMISIIIGIILQSLAVINKTGALHFFGVL